MPLVLALAVGAAAMTGGAASAASTKLIECATTGSMFFSAPLTTVPANGKMSFHWYATCAEEYTNGATGIVNYSGIQEISYYGSCITADLTGGGETGILVGGVAMTIVSTKGGIFAGQFVLVPSGLTPCGMTSAFAVEVAAGVVPGTIP
jgi:hypothetical protein